jgi:hypothetical protein
VRGIREIRLQFSHLSYIGGEALRVLGRLPARTALHLVGADGLRLRTLHVREPKAIGTDLLQRTEVSRGERGRGPDLALATACR